MRSHISRAGKRHERAALRARRADPPDHQVLSLSRLVRTAPSVERLGMLQRIAAGSAETLQRTRIGDIEVDGSGRMPRWTQGGKTYHLNVTTDTYHVTEEGDIKIHYFFEGTGADIKSTQPTKAEKGGKKKKKGRGKVATSTVFGKLPPSVQDFVRDNFAAILSAV